MSEWKPGKGVFMAGNEQTLEFLHECVEDIYNAMTDDFDVDEPSMNEMIDEGRALELLSWITGSATGWRKAEIDSAIGKAGICKTLEWADQADGKPTMYRVTVLVDKRGKLKFDIRQWYKERE
jgi:hypothetical protein